MDNLPEGAGHDNCIALLIGNVIASTDEAQGVRRVYTGPGQDSLTLALGANGRVTSVTVGSQLRQSFTYDSFGRVLTVTDGVGVTAVTNTYPATGTHRNLSQSTAPGSRVTTFGHDTFGRRTTLSAPTLPVQTTFYSVLNRVDSVVVATSPATVTKIGYNNLFPVSTTDPKGQVYQTAYNALGWITSETDPAGGVTSHAYSVDGDLRQTTSRRGQTVTVTYDALHRPLTQTGSNARSFSYANNGFVVTGTSAASTQTSFLNLRGQADSVRTVLQGQTFVQRFGYTAAGLLDTVTVTGPGGMAFQGRRYLYDEAQGILTGIRLGGALTQFATDGNANPTGITFPAGDTQQILRGVIQAPIRITTTAPYVETVERWLGLDKAGRITAHLNYPNADLGRFFQFDPLGRLIEGKDMQRPPSGGQVGCPEDPNAILCADGSVPSEPTAAYSVVGTPAVYSFDAVGNRLDQGGVYTTGNRITQFNGCSYTTDLDGNVTSRSGGGCGAGAQFFWSAEGELDSLHTGTTGVKYLYDAGGRLVVKRVNGVVQATFLWQGDNLLAELDGTATVKRAEYSYYPGLDNLHAVVINNERLYAHADGLGNVIALTDEVQAVRRVYAYNDWGNDAGTGGTLSAPNADRARWKGALWLGPELDIYYMRNRWYEPATGRFLSEDPIGLQGGINPGPALTRTAPSSPDSLFRQPGTVGARLAFPGSALPGSGYPIARDHAILWACVALRVLPRPGSLRSGHTAGTGGPAMLSPG